MVHESNGIGRAWSQQLDHIANVDCNAITCKVRLSCKVRLFSRTNSTCIVRAYVAMHAILFSSGSRLVKNSVQQVMQLPAVSLGWTFCDSIVMYSVGPQCTTLLDVEKFPIICSACLLIECSVSAMHVPLALKPIIEDGLWLSSQEGVSTIGSNVTQSSCTGSSGKACPTPPCTGKVGISSMWHVRLCQL